MANETNIGPEGTNMTMAAADTSPALLQRACNIAPHSHSAASLPLFAIACAIFWLLVARESVADAIPLAKGLHLARWTTLVLAARGLAGARPGDLQCRDPVVLALAVLAAVIYAGRVPRLPPGS